MVGQTISRYRITQKLGEGGMGVVYKAEDTRLERTIALKLLAAHLASDQETRQRFAREAKAAAAVNENSGLPPYRVLQLLDLDKPERAELNKENAP
jgi:serine/threonine protein kinase